MGGDCLASRLNATLLDADHEVVVEVDVGMKLFFHETLAEGRTSLPREVLPSAVRCSGNECSAAERACIRIAQGPGTEEVAGWRVFETNQASGDHLPPPSMHEVGGIETHPVRKHARIHTEGHIINVYAEGGPVNALARWLLPGDVISWQDWFTRW